MAVLRSPLLDCICIVIRGPSDLMTGIPASRESKGQAMKARGPAVSQVAIQTRMAAVRPSGSAMAVEGAAR